MKKTALLLFLIVFSAGLMAPDLMAQIPNAGFENWTNGSPDGWFANNIPGFYTTVTKSTTAHSGSAAVKGTAVQFATSVAPGTINTLPMFAVSQRYAKLTGYYQLTSNGGDRLAVSIALYKNGTGVGIGAVELPAASSYTQFTVDVQYFSPDFPTECSIIAATVGPQSGNDVHAGTSFLVDDLSVSGSVATGVEEAGAMPGKFDLKQNYPNPFNPSTKIEYSVVQTGFTSLKIYDVLGNCVSTLVNEVKPAGNYTAVFKAGSLPSGFYIYELKSGAQTLTRKMLLMK